jgi:AcrR family transcriptional regulator
MGYRCHVALTAKGRATRERIIVGAAEYLRGDIPGEVTLDDIRAISGTSKSQIFHYFPAGKEELLLEAARHESQRVLDDQPAGPGPNCRRSVAHHGAKYAQSLTSFSPAFSRSLTFAVYSFS